MYWFHCLKHQNKFIEHISRFTISCSKSATRILSTVPSASLGIASANQTWVRWNTDSRSANTNWEIVWLISSLVTRWLSFLLEEFTFLEHLHHIENMRGFDGVKVGRSGRAVERTIINPNVTSSVQGRKSWRLDRVPLVVMGTYK